MDNLLQEVEWLKKRVVEKDNQIRKMQLDALAMVEEKFALKGHLLISEQEKGHVQKQLDEARAAEKELLLAVDRLQQQPFGAWTTSPDVVAFHKMLHKVCDLAQDSDWPPSSDNKDLKEVVVDLEKLASVDPGLPQALLTNLVQGAIEKCQAEKARVTHLCFKHLLPEVQPVEDISQLSIPDRLEKYPPAEGRVMISDNECRTVYYDKVKVMRLHNLTPNDPDARVQSFIAGIFHNSWECFL